MRRLILLVVLVLGAGLLSVPPAAAVTGGGVFNVPPPWGTRAQAYRIVTHVEGAIRAVPARKTGAEQPEVLITSYLMDRRPTTTALIEACRRGASVRVILDSDIQSKSAQDLVSALNGDNVMDRNNDGTVDPTDPADQPQTGPCGDGEPAVGAAAKRAAQEPVDPQNSEPIGEVLDELPDLTERQANNSVQAPLEGVASRGGDNSYVTQCRGACRGGGGSMHTKFYAFSETGADEDVVVVSSSNLNAGGALKGWNDSYTMKGRPVSFNAYREIHDEMGVQQRGGYREVRDGPITSRFFPMANASKSNDPTLQDLKQIRCASGYPGTTQISIAMFYWEGVRGEYLLDQLLALARQKCRINIIVGAPSRDIGARLREASRARLVKVWDSRVFNKRRELIVRTHNKYVLVKGSFAGDSTSKLVMTGSQNWGHGSLDKSDDSSLNVKIDSAYNQYLRQWNQVRKHSVRMSAPR